MESRLHCTEIIAYHRRQILYFMFCEFVLYSQFSIVLVHTMHDWLGGHSANQEALKVSSRGSWLLCTPSLPVDTQSIYHKCICTFVYLSIYLSIYIYISINLWSTILCIQEHLPNPSIYFVNIYIYKHMYIYIHK